MDTLPFELLRLIFEHCDVATARNLRHVSPTLAEIGYDYIMPSHLTLVSWRDDVKRFHSIASHKRLRSSVDTLTFNFSEVDEYSARHASYFEHWIRDPEERRVLLEDAWNQFYQLDKRHEELAPFDTRSAMVEDTIRQLPNLKAVEITYKKCPYDIDVLKEVFRDVQSCRRMVRPQACKNINTIIAALKDVRISSLVIDRLPFEIFRIPDYRRLWFGSGRAFESLERLELTLDPSHIQYPASQLRAFNGLGHVLQFAPNLTYLSLAFQSHQEPWQKYIIWFYTLLEKFTFARLAELRLEGLNFAETDLVQFLVRHAATLERLRLGGRGLAKPFEASIGGVHLCQGDFRSLFRSLRGRLPRLRRLHLEGDFKATDARGQPSELYNFHAVADGNWDPVPPPPAGPAGATRSIDGRELERYVIHGGEYPDLSLTQTP